jgi:hypothetical protein
LYTLYFYLNQGIIIYTVHEDLRNFLHNSLKYLLEQKVLGAEVLQLDEAQSLRQIRVFLYVLQFLGITEQN